MAQAHAPQARSTRWSLEVARGRDVGKVFDLAGGEIVLGNGLDGTGGIDLRDQEAGSPRRMAARQASLALEGGDLVIRDLDSPGGTFVNRQRLLAGQSRRLQAGDEIQLGGVQLRVAVAGGVGPPLPAARPPSVAPPPPATRPPSVGPPPPASASRLLVPYTINGVVACRTWDDFLTVAAQRWHDLRDELASGRIADYVRRIQRTDLLPHEEAGRTLDERLDQWLGRLPVSGPSAPEVDVHPTGLEVRAGGGTTRHVLRISNVGYRLLRGTVRIEPAGTSWVRILPPYDGRPFETIEQTELPVEVTVPDVPGGPRDAAILIESNGGTRRIPVRIGIPGGPPAAPDAVGAGPGPTLAEWFRPAAMAVASVPAPTRIVLGVVVALAIRSLVLASALLPLGARVGLLAEPRLPALAIVCAAIGLVVGLVVGGRRADGGPLDAATTGVAAGLIGIMAAAVLHALVRTVERPLGDWSSSPWAVGILWTAIGAAIAGLTLLIPVSRRDAR